ncbi:MAG: hypothetical protein MMC33_005062 [Icmadophila ericetorum]|nr:hypothetical protein [Icmadophila ericetorum]
MDSVKDSVQNVMRQAEDGKEFGAWCYLTVSRPLSIEDEDLDEERKAAYPSIRYYWSRLGIAAMTNDYGRVKQQLMVSGIDSPNGSRDRTALSLAAQFGDAALVKLLLNFSGKKADREKQDKYGWMAVHYAGVYNKSEDRDEIIALLDPFPAFRLQWSREHIENGEWNDERDLYAVRDYFVAQYNKIEADALDRAQINSDTLGSTAQDSGTTEQA